MNTKFGLLTTLLLCACSATAAHAAPGDKLSDCIDLSSDYEATRFGSQYLIIRDNNAHYRVGFGGSCDAMTMNSKMSISTEGHENRLCASNTKVSMKRDSCKVRSVEEIRADEFERYAQRAKR